MVKNKKVTEDGFSPFSCTLNSLTIYTNCNFTFAGFADFAGFASLPTGFACFAIFAGWWLTPSSWLKLIKWPYTGSAFYSVFKKVV